MNYFKHMILNIKCAGYNIVHGIQHLIHAFIPVAPLNNRIHQG